MKKLILTSLVLVFVFNGQIRSQDLIIGIKGGATRSGLLHSNDLLVTKHRFGFLSGIGLMTPVSKSFDFGAELIYEQKGYISTITYVDKNGTIFATLEVTYMFDYLLLPCYLKLHTTGNTRFFINLGLYPSYLVSPMIDFPIVDYADNSIRREKLKYGTNYLRRLDIGGLVGAGAEFKIADKYVIELSLRYNNGFLNVDKLYFENGLLNSFNLSSGLYYIFK